MSVRGEEGYVANRRTVSGESMCESVQRFPTITES